MALSQVSGGYSGEWLNSNVAKSVLKDTGTASGDVVLILVSWWEYNGYGINTPTGFTLEGNFAIGGSSTQESRVTVFSRVIDGTEGASWSVSPTGAIYGSILSLTCRGSSALTVASVTAGTPASSTTCTAPSVSGTSGQGLVAVMGVSDPTTQTTPAGMTAGTVGPQNTNTGRFFFETLSSTGATGTRASTLGTSRDNGAFSVLLNGAAAGGSTYNQSAAGAMPAASGVLVRTTNKRAAGAMPAASGGVVKSTGKRLAGATPAAAGVVAKSTAKGFSGAMPGPSGGLVSASVFVATAAGSVPAPSGVLAKITSKGLVGSSPAPAGVLAKLTAVSRSGSMPGPSGEVVKLTATSAAGAMPGPNGNLGTSYRPVLGLTGIMGAIAGVVVGVFQAGGGIVTRVVGILGARLRGLIGG